MQSSGHVPSQLVRAPDMLARSTQSPSIHSNTIKRPIHSIAPVTNQSYIPERLPAGQQGKIPALHAANVQLNPLSNVQLSGQDSLEVASSEWSQTKSGKRKQKRRGNEKQPNALDTQSAASSPAQRDAAFQRASSPQDRHSDTHFDASVAAAALGSAGADGRLGNAVSPKQLGISLMPRAASPLGKEGLAGLRGHAAPQANQQSDSPGGSLGLLQEAIEAQQHEVAALQPSARLLATQDDADVLVLVSKLFLLLQASSFTASKEATQIVYKQGIPV